MVNWEAILSRSHLFRYTLTICRTSKLGCMEWDDVRLGWMLRPDLNAWETIWPYILHSTPTWVSCYKLNISSQMFMPRFEPGTSHVTIRIIYHCVNTLDLFIRRRFKWNVLFKFDSNCFFLSPSGPQLVSIIVLTTLRYGVHGFESLSQGWLALLFSILPQFTTGRLWNSTSRLGYGYFLLHYLNFSNIRWLLQCVM